MHWNPFIDQIQAHARAAPDRVALVDRHGAVTFAMLRDGIMSCADWLAILGIRDEAVGVLLPNRASFITALLGVAQVGGVAVLFPTSLTADELRHYDRLAGTRAMLSSPSHRRVLEAAGGVLAGRGHDDLELYTFDVAAVDGLRPGDFIVQFTSGADQPSKLAIRTQSAVWNEVQDFAEEVGLCSGLHADDTVAVLSSIFHSYGLIGGTLTPLCCGGRVVLADRFLPGEALRLIRRERPTMVFGVPVVYRALVDAPSEPGENLSSVRLWLSAGAPLPQQIDEAFEARVQRRICQDYGSTEAGVITLRPEADPALRPSVGRPVRHRRVIITDAHGAELSPGHVGDVIVSSPALARAYLGASDGVGPGLDGHRFETGDLGWMNADGYLFLTGRKTSSLHIAGTTVDPADVEVVIAEMPGVRGVAVVGVAGRADGGEWVKAVVEADGVTAEEIVQYCRDYLPHYLVPEVVEVTGQLPRTGAGKILRRVLRARP